MNYINTVCPHCGKELQIPQDAENIVCMFCAQPIDTKTLLSSQQTENYSRLMEEAESLLNDEIFSWRIPLRKMKQKIYPENFKSYEELFRPALKSYCLAATENKEAADHFAGVLLERFIKQLEQEGIKEKDNCFFDVRYMIVSFTVPAILEQNTPGATELADQFLAKWNTHFSKNPLGKASYETINSGFQKKLCFITTAVCSSLGRDDNCTELNKFRGFRDNWFAKTPQGPAKINEYYLFAPMIVRAIDRSPKKEQAYTDIWKEHLAPCMELIDSGKLDACAEKYEAMMRELEQKWLN